MSEHSLIPLITYWEKFIKEKKGSSPQDFARWLLQVESSQIPNNNKQITVVNNNEEYLAANYISKLNKYVKAYIKPLFSDNNLANSDEFSILSLISQMDRPTKREVCVANVMELSTGIDMIKRLLKANYISEEPHETDARSKRLSITKEGNQVLLSVYKKLAVLEQKVLADLPDKDKTELLRILGYLNRFHCHIYQNLTK